MVTEKSNRYERAQQLLTEGRVRLHPGTGTATVHGRTGTYTVRKDSGCDCPDAFNRDALNCYHAVAVKAVCAEYRHLAKLARQGQTVRPSVTLLRALGWQVEASASAPAREPWNLGHEVRPTDGTMAYSGRCACGRARPVDQPDCGWADCPARPNPCPPTTDDLSVPSHARLLDIHDALDAAGAFDPNRPALDGRIRRTAANPDGACVKCGSRQHARCGWRVRPDDNPKEAA